MLSSSSSCVMSPPLFGASLHSWVPSLSVLVGLCVCSSVAYVHTCEWRLCLGVSEWASVLWLCIISMVGMWLIRCEVCASVLICAHGFMHKHGMCVNEMAEVELIRLWHLFVLSLSHSATLKPLVNSHSDITHNDLYLGLSSFNFPSHTLFFSQFILFLSTHKIIKCHSIILS